MFENTGTDEVQYVQGVNRICMNDGTTQTYYSYNAHGEVVHLANSSGAVTRDYQYDAIGVEENPSANDDNPLEHGYVRTFMAFLVQE